MITAQDFRKAFEDLVYANIVDIFLIKSGETACSVGDNSIAFPGDAYENGNDFVVQIHEALDSNGIDIRPSLKIKNRTANGFVIETSRAATVKWISTRKTPKINFWT